MQIILSKNAKEGHWQVLFNGDGPYLIGSTIDVEAAVVLAKVKKNNPGAQVVVAGE